jgi:hypothetical protein
VKKIFINAPLKDAETGRPYFPGEHDVVDGEATEANQVPLASAQRFINAGYAEEVQVEEEQQSAEEEVPSV